jgi:WD40 repeat protein
VGGWQADRGGEFIAYVGFDGTIADIGVSDDGTTVAVTGTNAPTAVFRRVPDWLNHDGITLHLAVDRAGRRLATTTSEGDVAVWDLAGRRRVGGFRTAGAPAEVAYAPDGTLAVSTAAGTVELRDPAGRLIRTLPMGEGTGAAVVFSPDGSLLAAALASPEDPARPADTRPHRVVVWRADGWSRVGEALTGPFETTELLFTADGRRLVSAASVGEVVDMRIGFRSRVWTWRADDLTGADHFDVGPYQVTDAALSPDGARLAVVGADRQIALSGLDGSGMTRIATHPSPVRSVAFSPDGATLATSTVHDTYGWLWDARTGALKARLTGHSNVLNTVAFLPDGTLATASADTTVGLWQLDPAEAVRRVCGIVAPAERAVGREPPAAC